MDLQGKELQPDESALVELWHPISVEPATVLGWRRWLLEHNVTQPFKQCYREIYVLTDAEKETNTYSNRFAGHIIRQHQFQQLCTQRGWKYMLQGSFDSHNTPTLKLPKWNLSAQFWVEIPEGASDEILADSFIAMIVATDQVRFVRAESEDVPLTEILPIVFSETMRDVDLFVSVCSIGTDPNYTGGYGDYWHHFSFGELTTAGSMRKQALSDLLPMLKIADRCEIKEKFLVVRGDLRTYKIHLGSGNIMMEPNDQYLCIVSDRRDKALLNVRLPFAGDAVLSTIIKQSFHACRRQENNRQKHTQPNKHAQRLRILEGTRYLNSPKFHSGYIFLVTTACEAPDGKCSNGGNKSSRAADTSDVFTFASFRKHYSARTFARIRNA